MEKENVPTPDDPVGLRPHDVIDDIFNTVNDYCAEGFDAFEECLLTNLQVDELQARLLLQGSAHLYSQVQRRLAEHLQAFERIALQTSLSIPAGIIPDVQQEDSSTSFTAEDEERVDAQLAALRADIQEARAARQALELRVLAMDRELRTYGDASGLAAVAGPLAGGGNAAGDAAALAAGAAALAQLLPRVRAQHAACDGEGARAAAPADPEVLASMVDSSIAARRAALGAPTAADLRSLREHLQC